MIFINGVNFTYPCHFPSMIVLCIPLGIRMDYHKEPGRCTTNISRILEDYFLQCIKHFDINVLIKMYLKVQGICERLSNLLVKI